MRQNVAERVGKRRAALRAAGLRPVQIWVPDTRREGFAEECRRQSLLLRDDPQEAEVLDFIKASVDTKGDETNQLTKRAQVMIDKAVTMPREKLGEAFGRLDGELMISVNRAMAVFLGIA
jgi:hypothetical protein